jgi:hypothetical protein
VSWRQHNIEQDSLFQLLPRGKQDSPATQVNDLALLLALFGSLAVGWIYDFYCAWQLPL